MASRFVPVLTDLPNLAPSTARGARKNPLTDKESASLIRDARKERTSARTHARAGHHRFAAFARGRASGIKRAVVMHGSARAFATAEKFSPFSKLARSIRDNPGRARAEAFKKYSAHDLARKLEAVKSLRIADPIDNELRLMLVEAMREELKDRVQINPIGKTKRGKRGGWVAKSGQGKFEHLRVRPPGHFAKMPSLKTVPWAFISDARERAFVLKTLGLKAAPAGAKAITGHIKSTVTAGRVAGTKVKWLATGVQALLVPISQGKRMARLRSRAKALAGLTDAKLKLERAKIRSVIAKTREARTVRGNPGRLIILNPADPADPIAKTAKAMLPAARATLERVVHGASSAEIAALRKSLVTYKNFHGVWPPSIEKHGNVPGKQTRFLVGLGKADHVGYRVNKKYPGSNKEGAPFRHHFSSGQELVTNEEGKGLTVLDRRGARRGTVTTDWIRG